MTYAVLFDLRATHSFYTDGVCSGISIAPLPDTEAKLRKHRCAVRSIAGGVRIVTMLGHEGEPFLPFSAGEKLRFSLDRVADDVVFVTDMSVLAATSSPLYTNSNLNAGAGGNLALVSGGSAAMRGRVNMIAEVEIVMDGALFAQSAQRPVYIVPLRAKSMFWAYYCVTDATNAGTELHIVDQRPASEGPALVFPDARRRTLSEDPDPSDAVGVNLVAHSKGMSCVRFVSDVPIACREKPYRHLELRLGSEKLSSPLPNPSARKLSRMDLPTAQGSVAPCEVLTQVIEYHQHPTQT